ncbi:hypothetical protein GCM10027282_22600 [Frigoribacterium salinisoli]
MPEHALGRRDADEVGRDRRRDDTGGAAEGFEGGGHEVEPFVRRDGRRGLVRVERDATGGDVVLDRTRDPGPGTWGWTARAPRRACGGAVHDDAPSERLLGRGVAGGTVVSS